MKKPKKPGRPAVPASKRRSVIIPVRFTPKEARQIRQQARLSKMTVSEWSRGTLLWFNA